MTMRCKKITCFVISMLIFWLASMQVSLWAAEGTEGQGEILWQIGKADNSAAEFALNVHELKQYLDRFGQGAMYLVGKSDPKKDWPFIQPGPIDHWGSRRSYTFTILFGLENLAKSGTCTLTLDTVDTHSTMPPLLFVRVNEQTFKYQLPPGAGDASMSRPANGRQYKLEIPLPANTLKKGNNSISITTETGSWIIYDQIVLRTPPGYTLAESTASTQILRLHDEPYLVRKDDGRLYQPILATVFRVGDPIEANITIDGHKSARQTISPGFQTIEGLAPAVKTETSVEVQIETADKGLAKSTMILKPVKKWNVYLLHHTHLDIGYTHIQSEVLALQGQHLEEALKLAKQSADYPPGSRFKWLPEGLWGVEGYMKKASPAEKERFIEAVRKGWVGLDALFGNELTALCRPEELFELTAYARQLSEKYNLTIDSAMITDVPGYTWGLIPVLAQSGVKYLSIGPNFAHRIGYTLTTWGDIPFYWISPSGKEKVLCWMAGKGYSWFHTGLNWKTVKNKLTTDRVFGYLKRLEESGYPYDMVQVRYNIGSDNGPPDPHLADIVKAWNEKYEYPKLIIATTSEMFHEFEKCYGDKLPVVRGDFTPYWEDGAGSSAQETAINRAAAERMVQAETLWALLNPEPYPQDDFYEAWRNILLYDEHTWGSWNSISDPDCDFTKGQWATKQAFAVEADKQSQELLNRALEGNSCLTEKVKAVQVFNTCSWPRTDLIILSGDWELAGDGVKDAQGKWIPSQKLSTGELAFLAGDVPPLGAGRFTLEVPSADKPKVKGVARAEGSKLFNDTLQVVIDEKTGAIQSLRRKGIDLNFVDNKNGLGLNDYFYVQGRDPKDPKRNGPVKIRVKENGPLVASLLIESDAPGCRKLIREIRITAGLERVDIINIIDKERVYKQEAVHVGFACNVPNGVLRMQTPWAVVRPEVDQLDGACKNYFTVQRWVDISNQDVGLTWATVDAPLIEIGAITCDARDKSVGWFKKIDPSATFYSYVMNNYWETNYKAYQEGPTTFRYSLLPHNRFDAGSAARFGTDCSQPLICVPVSPDTAVPSAPLQIVPVDVVLTSLRPGRDGKSWIARLYNASEKTEQVDLKWNNVAAEQVWLSNPFQAKIEKMQGPLTMAPYEIVTLYITHPQD